MEACRYVGVLKCIPMCGHGGIKEHGDVKA